MLTAVSDDQGRDSHPPRLPAPADHRVGSLAGRDDLHAHQSAGRAAIADLADVDPIVVPPPQIVHAVSNGEIARLLPPNLWEIPGATGSHGAHLRADPALSLADPEDRARQVIRWLCQIAADAGLSGMERLTQTELPAPELAALPSSSPAIAH